MKWAYNNVFNKFSVANFVYIDFFVYSDFLSIFKRDFIKALIFFLPSQLMNCF